METLYVLEILRWYTLKNDKELVRGRDFVFDFNTLTLTTKVIQRTATYRFVIYVNNDYVSDLMVRLHPEQFKYD